MLYMQAHAANSRHHLFSPPYGYEKRIAIIIDPYHVPISVIGFDEMSGSSVVRAGNDVNFIYLVVFSP